MSGSSDRPPVQTVIRERVVCTYCGAPSPRCTRGAPYDGGEARYLCRRPLCARTFAVIVERTRDFCKVESSGQEDGTGAT